MTGNPTPFKGLGLHTLPSAFAAALARDFPADFASVDPADLRTYGRDWASAFSPRASILCRPRTRDEVSRLLRLCSEHRVPVVPSGGRTGLACGALAVNGELVLSLERMQHMEPVDALGLTLRVEAGATLEAVQQHCAEAGLLWPVELDSRGSQVGGTIATNAGGMRVVRYGLARNWVLGLTIVLASGDSLELDGALEKNSAGLDLRQLFVGSEGILGVITEATLKLTRRPASVAVVLLGLPGFDAVVEVFERARNAPFALMACEFFTDHCVARVVRHRGFAPPFGRSCSDYALVEVTPESDAVERWVEALRAEGLVTAATGAQSREHAAQLWAYRQAIVESLLATGLPRMMNIGLPIARLRAFRADLEALLASRHPDWELCLFGPIGDGNLHVNVMKPDTMDKRAFLAGSHAFERELVELVRAHHGTVNAEHGIGLLRKAWLGHARSATEIELMRAIKRAVDPLGLMNPGKVL